MSYYALAIPLAWFLAFRTPLGVLGLWLGLLAAQCCTSLMMGVYLFGVLGARTPGRNGRAAGPWADVATADVPRCKHEFPLHSCVLGW